MGHKANHAFVQNAKYDLFPAHPRFGTIKLHSINFKNKNKLDFSLTTWQRCIRTIKPVAAGAEILVDYGYELGSLLDPGSDKSPDAPPWYLDAFARYKSS